jgi:glycosyltransferase involved in cell wall biosynthesis
VKRHSQVSRVATKEAIFQQTTAKVCMHVRGVARTDGRVMREAIALKDAGFAVTILDIEDDTTRLIEEDNNGIHVKHIMKPSWLKPAHSRLQHLIFLIEKVVYTTIKLIQIPTDVYHAHDENTLIACYLAALWCKNKLIFDAHELPLRDIRKRWLHALLINLFTFMLRRCSGIITVSSPIAQKICELYHVPKASLVRNVPEYQETQRGDQIKQHLGLAVNTRIALYQGNLQSDRGLDQLIQAASFLSQDVVIVMMGRGIGETPAQLEALIVSEGVADRVKILPPVAYKELATWTSSADIGLIIYSPNYSSNVQMCLPNKLFEYLMSGLPVLASQLDAVIDILNSYGVGRIVSSLNPVDVGTAINSMLGNSVDLTSMHLKALEAARHLCWGKESQQLIQLYRDIFKAG